MIFQGFRGSVNRSDLHVQAVQALWSVARRGTALLAHGMAWLGMDLVSGFSASLGKRPSQDAAQPTLADGILDARRSCWSSMSAAAVALSQPCVGWMTQDAAQPTLADGIMGARGS